MKSVIMVGTMDTKGEEYEFIKDIIEKQGINTIVIDAGVMGEPKMKTDITNEEVAKKADTSLKELRQSDDRGTSIQKMSEGVQKAVEELYEANKVGGIISLGGSGGTAIGTSAMQVLPVGIPKIMVSTMASGDTKPYVQAKDIMMLYSVTDIAGLNRISKSILSNAALAMSGMVKNKLEVERDEKPLIAATMFGVTTPCVNEARKYLEENGYEVLVFHATGTGGKAMEDLVESGFIDGVLDITTTELADELVGGVLSAGADRLEAAGSKAIPQVVSTGALDMVNFGAMDTVPGKFQKRKLYKHNQNVTLMRTTVEENRELGKIIASKLNKSEGPTKVFLPLKGVSMIDVEGEDFYDPEADEKLFKEIKDNLDDKIEVVEINTDINSKEFALEMAKSLDEMIKNTKGGN